MKITNLGGFSSVNAFVEDKLRRYNMSDKSFRAVFSLMFSEENNILWEESRGYRISKTTYGQARSLTLHKASTLKAKLGELKPDAVIGIYMDNSLDWILTFWAILAIGCRPLLLNRRLDTETLEYALRVTNAAAVISDGQSFSVKTILSGELVEGANYMPADFGSEILVMSSGTSAHVKICAYTAEEFYNQIQGSYSIIKKCTKVKEHYEGELKLLTFLPFYHIFGLVAVYVWFAFFSRTFVRLNDMQPQTITNTIKRHKVTHIFAVPLFWEKVYEQAMRTARRFRAGGRVFQARVQGSARGHVRRKRCLYDNGRQLYQSAGARIFQRHRLPSRGRLRHERNRHHLSGAEPQAQPAQFRFRGTADDGH